MPCQRAQIHVRLVKQSLMAFPKGPKILDGSIIDLIIQAVHHITTSLLIFAIYNRFEVIAALNGKGWEHALNISIVNILGSC